MSETDIAVIGGSGLYNIEALKNKKEVEINTPFGKPSDAVITGEIEGVTVAFLPRHGRGHKLNPSEIPQKANIWALKSLGVKTVISVSAVGSLKEELAPGHFFFPNQFVDNTKGRPSTFFEDGIVAHVSFAEPVCLKLSSLLYSHAVKAGVKSHKGGIAVCMEGPQFSTKAESNYHRNMGYSVIGMTSCPEAKLAREAGFCYAPICMVTDYDVWKEGEEVTATQVHEIMAANIKNVQNLLVNALPHIAKAEKECKCSSSLKGAVMTDKAAFPKETVKKLELFLKDVL